MQKEQFMSFYKDIKDQKALGDCYDAITKALKDIGIFSNLTLIGALATVRVECGREFKPITEHASGAAYEGNTRDLGNYCPGDGVRYKGRGLIQITGRANYTTYRNKFGVDIVCNPELALDLTLSAKILAQYFTDRKVNVACDAKDWRRVRMLVNGSAMNGLDEFLSVVNQYMKYYVV